jgi:hypothetical protein
MAKTLAVQQHKPGIRLNASTNREIDAAFATLVRERIDALFVGPDAFSKVGAHNLLPWRHVMRFPRHMHRANMPKQEG